MRLPYSITPTLFVSLLLIVGCSNREITAYRAPKDPVPPAQPAAPAAAQLPTGASLPEGHPPIGQSANPGPMGAMPDGHPPIGQPANPGPMGAMPDGTAPTVAAGNALTWTAPDHWTAKALGSMRKGSYAIAGDAGAVADLAITAFPGDTGGLFANVNRWRGQVGLPPIAESELATSVQHLDVNSFHIDIVDLTGTAGTPPTRLLGAIVPHEGQTWFFKLTGPDPLVAKEQPAFREFLNTIKLR